MSASEVFKQFFAKLAKSLPMNDAIFIAELFSNGLLPGDHYDQVQSLGTRAEKATHFLYSVIRPSIITDVGSFNKLLDIMEDCEYHNIEELAQQIRSELKGEPGKSPFKKSTALDVAADELRATYQTQSPPSQDDWPNYRINKYVRLALVEKPEKIYRADHEHHIGMLGLRGGVDKIQNEKQHLNFDDLSEIFCNSTDRLILITGGPGIGKTTLATEICVKWAKDEFLSTAFHIVIMLLLRSIQKQSTKQVFEELIGKEAFQELTDSKGGKSLIILEGLDEITLERQQSDEFLTKLIHRKLWQYSKIVVTSRPHACQQLMKKANKIIEILGFGDKEVKEFVKDSFAQDITHSDEVFLRQLEEHPQLYSLCHVPISLAMIIDIFKETKTLPSTLTKLYYRFITMMLYRESQKMQNHNQVYSTVTMSQNDEDILHQALLDVPKERLGNILLLSKLAFHGFFAITENQSDMVTKTDPKIIFNQSDLTQCGIVNADNYDGHSLLKMESLHHFAGGQTTYNFIHLTVQEFLCAVYMLTLSQEEQYHLLKECFDAYPNIMILYCGLTKLDCRHVIYSKLTSRDSTVTAVKCLYEGQWNNDAHESTSPLALHMGGETLLPYDILCVSYTYCNYPVTHLNLNSCHIGDQGARILAKCCLNNNETTKLQELNFFGTMLTSEGMKHVMKIVTSSPSLKVLDVSWTRIGVDGISLCLQHINTLTELKVAGCGLSIEGAKYIKVMLMENNKLQSLDVSFNNISNDGVRLITEGLQCNNTLTKLVAECCRISVTGAACIKEVLIKLQHLDISNNKIGDDGVKHTTEGLQQNDTLAKLILCDCKISAKGATYIKEMLMENKKLQHLDISSNKIGDDGVSHITEGLQQNDTLTDLMLVNCEISAKGAAYIKEMLMENKKLQHLDIKYNKIIGDDGVRHTTEGLQQNDTLAKLILCDCEISAKGAISISEMIKINHTLQVLDISNNPIGDEGITAIARTLDDASISKLNVQNCNITDTGAKSLSAALKINHTLKSLILDTNVTVDGAIAILEAAVANGVCQEVWINDKCKSHDKVKELMSILEKRKRQKESNVKLKDECHVTMPTEDHHTTTETCNIS